MGEPLPDVEYIGPEALEVRHRRKQEALDAGLSESEAQVFAENGEDVGLLRKLVRDGCPAHLIGRLVGRPE
jgi:hypothetical protein